MHVHATVFVRALIFCLVVKSSKGACRVWLHRSRQLSWERKRNRVSSFVARRKRVPTAAKNVEEGKRCRPNLKTRTNCRKIRLNVRPTYRGLTCSPLLAKLLRKSISFWTRNNVSYCSRVYQELDVGRLFFDVHNQFSRNVSNFLFSCNNVTYLSLFRDKKSCVTDVNRVIYQRPNMENCPFMFVISFRRSCSISFNRNIGKWSLQCVIAHPYDCKFARFD